MKERLVWERYLGGSRWLLYDFYPWGTGPNLIHPYRLVGCVRLTQQKFKYIKRQSLIGPVRWPSPRIGVCLIWTRLAPFSQSHKGQSAKHSQLPSHLHKKIVKLLVGILGIFLEWGPNSGWPKRQNIFLSSKIPSFPHVFLWNLDRGNFLFSGFLHFFFPPKKFDRKVWYTHEIHTDDFRLGG